MMFIIRSLARSATGYRKCIEPQTLINVSNFNSMMGCLWINDYLKKAESISSRVALVIFLCTKFGRNFANNFFECCTIV